MLPVSLKMLIKQESVLCGKFFLKVLTAIAGSHPPPAGFSRQTPTLLHNPPPSPVAQTSFLPTLTCLNPLEELGASTPPTLCQLVPSGNVSLTSFRTWVLPFVSTAQTPARPTEICFSWQPVGGSTQIHFSPSSLSLVMPNRQ